jgi:transcriptional regulator with XRE-family HTH domain
MEKQIKKLKQFYGLSYKALAEKIGCTERQLFNARKGINTGRFLKEKIENMVQKIESL